MKHTPKPWTAHDRIISNGDYLITGKLGEVGVCRLLKAKGEMTANANLISAAPDLLDALKECAPHVIEGDGYHPNGLQAQIHAAIAKAEGRPHD